MTTIKEILKPFYDDNMIVKIVKAEQLERQLNSLAETMPMFSFFVYLVNHYCKKFVFPEDVVELCNSLKIITMDDLIEWTKKVDGSVIMPVIEPVLSFTLITKRTGPEIIHLIKNYCQCENTCKWDFGDADYYLLTEDNLKEILAKCPIDKRTYTASTMDCEDFARATKAWVTLRQHKNIAFANVEVNFYLKDKPLFAHGINLVPLADGKIVFVEPQKDSIWPANKPEFGFGADEMRLRFIQF